MVLKEKLGTKELVIPYFKDGSKNGFKSQGFINLYGSYGKQELSWWKFF